VGASTLGALVAAGAAVDGTGAAVGDVAAGVLPQALRISALANAKVIGNWRIITIGLRSLLSQPFH
jgi:hypothetical protein